MKTLGKEEISKKNIKKHLCRAPYSWHSAKTPFAECHAPALGKVFFLFLKYFAECPLDGTRQRFNFFLLFLCRVLLCMHSAKRKFKKKIKTFFAECLMAALGKATLCRVPCPGTRQSFFGFFVFGLQFFCAAFLKHQELLVTIWRFFVPFCYI